MRTNHLIVLICLAKHLTLSAFIACSPEPIASCTPLNSILYTWPKSDLEYCESRLRLSTCTGVIWVGDNKLISIGFHDHSLDTYQFDPTIPLLVAYKGEKLDPFQRSPLGKLENLAIFKDGSLVAVANNGRAFIHLYKVSNAKFVHVAEIPKNGWWVHGVRFSRNMDFLAYTVFGEPGKIKLYHLKNNWDKVEVKLAQSMATNLFQLHPKGVDFSLDDRFIVVCLAINNSKIPKPFSGALTVYSFDSIHGVIDPTPVSTIGMSELLSVPEDVCFSPDGTFILVTNQGNDTVTIHAFDPETGQLGESRILLQNPEAQLSFPHGLNISPDGKYLAVTNYGDDTVKIYEFIESP
jgi:DNA-binding beta-propeller fold protein YncE